MIYKILEIKDVFFAGDLHGEFKAINFTINRYDLENCAIIVCGDIGIGFEKEEYYRQTFAHISKTLKKKNVHLFLFRGNHDNKEFFDGKHFTEFEFIRVIPDYSVIMSHDKNILCVGGAISVDRQWRIQKMNLDAINYMKQHNCKWDVALKEIPKIYWGNEYLMYDYDLFDVVKIINSASLKIDTICTHTAPSFCYPTDNSNINGFLEKDKSLGLQIKEERNKLDNLYKLLIKNGHNIENWYYGHFHGHNVEIIDNVKYTLLDMVRDNKLDLI